LRAAFRVDSIWKQPQLAIAFLDGSPEDIEWVKQIVNNELAPVLSSFPIVWDVPPEESDIRISFALKGQAWSTVGTDSRLVPKDQPTMNLGWLDNDTDYGAEAFKGTGQVVIHEFGHALGMIHEHQNPKGNPIVWNKEVVYEELAKTNGWDMETTDHNMFKKYGDAEKCQQAKEQGDDQGQLDYCVGELVNGSEYDVKSIMHYFYPPSWIEEGPTEIPVNTSLSKLDKKWLGKYYGTKLVDDDIVLDGQEIDEEEIIEEEVDDDLLTDLNRRHLIYQNIVASIEESDEYTPDDKVVAIDIIKPVAPEEVIEYDNRVKDDNIWLWIMYMICLILIYIIVITDFI